MHSPRITRMSTKSVQRNEYTNEELIDALVAVRNHVGIAKDTQKKTTTLPCNNSSHNRKSWLLTHGISGGFLNYDMFKTEEKLSSIDECHYTCDSSLVYTYIHFKNAVSTHTMKIFMDRMKISNNIVASSIFGYDAIASSTPEESLENHVGFKIIVQHYKINHPSFKSCTDGKPGLSRGLIWKHDSISRLREMANGRNKKLALVLDEIVSELQEYKRKEEACEYDVVKKRHKMEQADTGIESGDTSPRALKKFEEFEEHVLEALGNITRDDSAYRNQEILQMEEAFTAQAKPVIGGMYVAMSASISIPKIGATRRSNASERLRELSQHVPQPFKLIYWVPTTTPYKVEADVHRHFHSYRVRKPGANSEFFDIDIQTIGKYLKTHYPTVESYEP